MKKKATIIRAEVVRKRILASLNLQASHCMVVFGIACVCIMVWHPHPCIPCTGRRMTCLGRAGQDLFCEGHKTGI